MSRTRPGPYTATAHLELCLNLLHFPVCRRPKEDGRVACRQDGQLLGHRIPLKGGELKGAASGPEDERASQRADWEAPTHLQLQAGRAAGVRELHFGLGQRDLIVEPSVAIKDVDLPLHMHAWPCKRMQPQQLQLSMRPMRLTLGPAAAR